jgi:uncharacterized protein YlzI (FlbEa/FlbD family)
MATKITLVTGESIQLRHEIDEAVSEINAALAAGSLMSVKSARGGEFWINPAQIVRVEETTAQ